MRAVAGLSSRAATRDKASLPVDATDESCLATCFGIPEAG